MIEIKNKLKLLGISTVIGICMVVVIYAAGLSEQLPLWSQITLVGVVDENNKTLNLSQNGKIVQNIKLPEGIDGVEYSYDKKSGKISIKYITKKKLNDQRETRKAVLDRAIRIAESNKIMQQLITGKNYTIPMSGILQGQEGDAIQMIIVIENKNYEVTVNLSTEKVATIEEVKELNNSFNFSSSGGAIILDIKKSKI